MYSECINLYEAYGKRYKINFDSSYSSFNVPRDRLDPWYMQIPCRGNVTIYPHGGELLAVELDGHHYKIAALIRLGLKVHQRGDRDCTLLFEAKDFDKVAAIVKPHRKPQFSEEQRQAASERMKQYNQNA